MKASDPRNRILNFRLTEKEYDDLCSAFRSCGGRSLSEFARLAVMTYADIAPVPADSLDTRLLGVREKLLAIDSNLDAVLARLGRGSMKN